jgi:hypothetical protein
VRGGGGGGGGGGNDGATAAGGSGGTGTRLTGTIPANTTTDYTLTIVVAQGGDAATIPAPGGTGSPPGGGRR